jgi:hypothetical protein
MNIIEPVLKDYDLTLELIEKYNKQTLDDFLDKPYLQYITLVLSIIFWIYNDGISFVLNNLALGFFSIMFILPLTMGGFTIILMILNTLISSIIKFYHPLTRNIELFTKDLNDYKVKLREYEEEQEKLKKDFWYSLSGHEFEHEVAKLFKQFGFRVEVTKGSDDKGVDINMWDNNKYIVVQCKAHKKKLSPAISRELYGTMISHNASEAYLVTLEGVSDKSKEFILDKPIKVFDVDNLVLMQEEMINKNGENYN